MTSFWKKLFGMPEPAPSRESCKDTSNTSTVKESNASQGDARPASKDFTDIREVQKSTAPESENANKGAGRENAQNITGDVQKSTPKAAPDNATKDAMSAPLTGKESDKGLANLDNATQPLDTAFGTEAPNADALKGPNYENNDNKKS